MNKHELIQKLSLQTHPEGGYYSETYRSELNIKTDRVGQQRSAMTSIYYLLTDDSPIDYFHVNQSDILHYFHSGSPITYFLIDPQGNLQTYKLGLNLNNREVPQLLVPGGYWKAAVLEEGEFGLLGEAVAPGFDFRDMEFGRSDDFRQRFPDLWEQVTSYVKS
ncbi:MAG: cupin domain-containing protein [Cyanobacteriota bacterium]|nr:cupin domain-containing protein [Cyanobacteriota bacterium]